MSSKLETLLLDVLEASETGYWSYDLSTGEAFLSDWVYEMLGYTAQTFPMSLEGILSLLHPEDTQPFLVWFEKSTGTHAGTFQGEFRFRTAAGGWRWIQVRGKVVERTAEGKARRVLGTHLDITQKKLVEQAWGESEALWTSLVDQAPMGVSLLSRDGQILFANRFEAKQHDELIVGRNWKDFMPDELRLVANWVLEHGFSQPEPFVFETYRTLNQGGIVRFENHVSPVLAEAEVKALLIVSLDKTAEQRTRRRQNMAARRMERLLALHNNPRTTPLTVLETAVDAALDVTGSSFGCLFLLAEEATRFIIHTVVDRQTGRGLPEGSLRVVPVGLNGTMESAVVQRAPVVVNDVIGTSTLPLGKIPSPVTLHRFVAVPLMEHDTVVAVLGSATRPFPTTRTTSTN